MSTGLRERKKQQTRQHIADTARRLFAEQGFEAVTVAEVARAADVAEKTVFNYFPTKEDLFYSRMEAFEEEMLAAIREREPGESVANAFARFIRRPRGVFAIAHAEDKQAAAAQLETWTRVITSSPALLARERRLFERYTHALAGLLAEESGASADDVAPHAAAHALIGVHRSLIDFVRRRELSGASIEDIARDLPRQADEALELLARGLK